MKKLKRRDDKLKQKLYHPEHIDKDMYEQRYRQACQEQLDKILRTGNIAEYEYQKKTRNEELIKMFGKGLNVTEETK